MCELPHPAIKGSQNDTHTCDRLNLAHLQYDCHGHELVIAAENNHVHKADWISIYNLLNVPTLAPPPQHFEQIPKVEADDAYVPAGQRYVPVHFLLEDPQMLPWH